MDFFNIDNIMQHYELDRESYELQIVFKLQIFLLRMQLDVYLALYSMIEFEFLAFYNMMVIVITYFPTIMKEGIIYELIDSFILTHCRLAYRKYSPIHSNVLENIIACFIYIFIRYGILEMPIDKVPRDSAHVELLSLLNHTL